MNIHETDANHKPLQFGLLDLEDLADIVKKDLVDTCDFFQPLEILKG